MSSLSNFFPVFNKINLKRKKITLKAFICYYFSTIYSASFKHFYLYSLNYKSICFIFFSPFSLTFNGILRYSLRQKVLCYTIFY
jgi:hypothetical protein